jgi:serine phosphatase RsbU (regulator of sigma subunit)
VDEAGHRAREGRFSDASVSEVALGALAGVTRRLADGTPLAEALEALVQAAAAATSSDLVIARALEGGAFGVRAVSAPGTALAAELEGTSLDAAEVAPDGVEQIRHLAQPLRRVVERHGIGAVLQVPAVVGDRMVGTLELLRSRGPFDPGERLLARLAADQLGVALRGLGGTDGRATDAAFADVLELAGDALAAGSDATRTAEQIALLAAEATGAAASIVWRVEDDRSLSLLSSYRLGGAEDALDSAREAARRAVLGPRPVVSDDLDGLPAGASVAATLQLGQPPLGAVQLLFAEGTAPPPRVLRALSPFGARAAHALRSSERTRRATAELDRSRALLAVVGQAIAQLSLAHTLETAIERVSELLDTDRLAVYLVEQNEQRLLGAAGRGLAGPHVRVAERLLELGLGPFRGRGFVLVEDAAADERLGGVADAVAESGIETALAVPLVVPDEVIGLLAIYPDRAKPPTADDAALVTALAAQLAVAVQNARLHEQAKQLGFELEQALSSERHAARELGALYEISRSFAHSLSLETTLDAVARAAVELLDADAAVIRMPDARGDVLLPAAVHLADDEAGAAIRPIIERPHRLSDLPQARLRRPLLLDAAGSRELGPAYELLEPFLDQGASAAVLPISTPGERLGTLTVVSLSPASPLSEERVESALTLAGQAALAIDRARLYEQQKGFADSMQRSLLPQAEPELEGLELAHVYASSARVDVGGDVYDFMTLNDGRFAVVLGDVTGHGIDAAADMAMAKFVFRSIAREHPSPADFLAAANDVVVGEIGAAKFITMLYLTIDPATGELACASAGHPAPRIVRPDGAVEALPARGLAVGIVPGQEYEEVVETLPPGAAIVLFTDGVVEARRDGELYGEERLERLLAAKADLSPAELVQAVLEDCRAFAGELTDDCAVVVLRKT